MKVAKDRFVIIEYDIRLDDGTYIKGGSEMASMNFVAGYDEILPALERRLLGSEEGSSLEFVIPCREAFGDYDSNQVFVRSFDEFPEGRNLPEGKWIIATNDNTQAQYGYFVKSKSDNSVVLDFNHPLAGKDLHYRVKIVRVRPATEEELNYLRPCRDRGGELDQH